jgi:hypothetical protein
VPALGQGWGTADRRRSSARRGPPEGAVYRNREVRVSGRAPGTGAGLPRLQAGIGKKTRRRSGGPPEGTPAFRPEAKSRLFSTNIAFRAFQVQNARGSLPPPPRPDSVGRQASPGAPETTPSDSRSRPSPAAALPDVRGSPAAADTPDPPDTPDPLEPEKESLDSPPRRVLGDETDCRQVSGRAPADFGTGRETDLARSLPLSPFPSFCPINHFSLFPSFLDSSHFPSFPAIFLMSPVSRLFPPFPSFSRYFPRYPALLRHFHPFAAFSLNIPPYPSHFPPFSRFPAFPLLSPMSRPPPPAANPDRQPGDWPGSCMGGWGDAAERGLRRSDEFGFPPRCSGATARASVRKPRIPPVPGHGRRAPRPRDRNSAGGSRAAVPGLRRPASHVNRPSGRPGGAFNTALPDESGPFPASPRQRPTPRGSADMKTDKLPENFNIENSSIQKKEGILRRRCHFLSVSGEGRVPSGPCRGGHGNVSDPEAPSFTATFPIPEPQASRRLFRSRSPRLHAPETRRGIPDTCGDRRPDAPDTTAGQRLRHGRGFGAKNYPPSSEADALGRARAEGGRKARPGARSLTRKNAGGSRRAGRRTGLSRRAGPSCRRWSP